MSIIKAVGNMYDFSSVGLPQVYTWNPIKGACRHNCSYCYVKYSRAKRFYEGEPRLDKKQLKVNLGSGKCIFVSSMNDMWGEWIPMEWEYKILEHCNKYPDNTYFFQTKNPNRFLQHEAFEHNHRYNFPQNSIFCTTIETNKCNAVRLITYYWRVEPMVKLQGRKSITIEPIMDFDLEVMVGWIKQIAPEFVSIGADSKHNNLPEPSPEKVRELITELQKFTKVVIKDNLYKIIGRDNEND